MAANRTTRRHPDDAKQEQLGFGAGRKSSCGFAPYVRTLQIIAQVIRCSRVGIRDAEAWSARTVHVLGLVVRGKVIGSVWLDGNKLENSSVVYAGSVKHD